MNTLSHELRTPIATIIASVDTLKEHSEILGKAQQQTLFDEIDIASTRLNRQVENLLNMSRLESGMLKPKYDWIDVNEHVFSVIEKAKENIQTPHKILFTDNETFPLIKIDGMMLEQILLNLIHNAMLYTPQNSQIIIETSLQDDKFIVEVADTGTGFPAETIPLVFDKFYRIPHTKAGGTGLGLSIVKGFVSTLNGEVFLENIQPHGAKFTIKIPCEITYINRLKNE